MDNGMDKEEAYLAELEKAKIGILKQYALNKLFSQISVNEADALEFYESNKDYFGGEASVKASHILVDTMEEAFEIKCEITDGLTFEEAASKYSKCPSNSKGGDLGFFSTGMMVPEFENAAFSLEIDSISEPVKTQFGYHIIKVVDKKEAALQPFEAMKTQIVSQLMQEKQQQTFVKRVEELKKKYEIKVNI
jgi:peptidyl-prolyl cis-trans isomerase C